MPSTLAFPKARAYPDRPRVWIERLESRRLMSVTLGEDGVVVIDDPEPAWSWRITDIEIHLSSRPSPDGRAAGLERVDIAWANYQGLGQTVDWSFERDHLSGVRFEGSYGHALMIVTDATADGHIPVTLLSNDAGDTLLGARGDDHFGKDLMVDGDSLPTHPDFRPARDPALFYSPDGAMLGRAVITDDGTLSITGGDGAQSIAISDYEGAPEYAAREWIMVRFGYVAKLFPRARVARVVADAGPGNDAIALYSNPNPIGVPVTFVGGPGNDSLLGAWYKSQYPNDLEPIPHDALGPLTLIGGDGDDYLIGGAGQTFIDAGPGHDTIETRGHDTTIIDTPDAPPPPPAPADPPPPTPQDPNPDPLPDNLPAGAAPTPPPPFTADRAQSAPSIFDNASPWLVTRDDKIWAS